jgi:L-lactate permease
MLKITSNHNKQYITHSFTLGQSFPDIMGKLISIEISGKELSKLMEKKEIPLCSVENSCLTWHGKQAGGILKILKEILC